MEEKDSLQTLKLEALKADIREGLDSLEANRGKPLGIEQLKAIGYAYYEFSKEYPQYANIFHDVGQKIPGIHDKEKKELK